MTNIELQDKLNGIRALIQQRGRELSAERDLLKRDTGLFRTLGEIEGCIIVAAIDAEFVRGCRECREPAQETA